MSAKSPQAPEPNPEQLLAALDQPLAPVRVSMIYRMGLVLVAAAMILLPVLYLAVIAGLGWLVYLHATHSVVILDGGGSGRMMALKLAIYLAPLIAGGVAVLFMLKPLLARPQRPPTPLRITASDQPLFFRFVEHLTRAVGAPMPRSIRVDCEVNASASFRRGFASLFGSDLVLTVGLPLVSGFSLRQLAGVLAHEFGHFAQGGAMRVTYLIRSINGWFARVVYERDRWDERLDQATRESEHWAAQLILVVTKATVWISRGVLWVLMNLGHLLSCFMLRQMEYDADRYEARVAGSDAFESTAHRLRQLFAGSQAAIQQLQLTWSDGHLGDDLPALISRRAAAVPEEAMQELHRMALDEKSSIFATHPADGDRIASARREGAPGIFRFDQPAALLFEDFDGLCRRATLHYYQSHHGLEVSSQQLVSSEELEAEEEMIEAGGRAIAEIFGDGLAPLRPLELGSSAELAAPDGAPATDGAPTGLTEELKEQAAQAVETIGRCGDRLADAAAAEALLQAGFGVDASSFHLPTADLAGVERSRVRAEQQASEAKATLGKIEEIASRRMVAGLRRLHTAPPSSASERVARRREECRRLLPALQVMVDVRKDGFELRCDFSRLAALFHGIGEGEATQKAVDKILEISRSMTGHLSRMRATLAEAEHPFTRGAESQSIGEVLIGEFPPAEEPGSVGALAEHVLGAVPFLYFRVVGRLATIALEMEPASTAGGEESRSATA